MFLDKVETFLDRWGKPIGFVIIALVAVWIGWQGYKNWHKIDWQVYHLDVGYLLLALLLHAFGLGLGGLGWASIVREVSPEQRFWESVRIYLLSNVGRNIPGSIWHIAGRVYLHKQAGISGIYAAVASGVEIAVVGIAGIVLYVLGMLVRPLETLLPWWGVWGLLGICVVLIFPPVFNRIVNGLVQLASKKVKPKITVGFRATLWLVLLYCIVLILGGIILFCVINAVSVTVVEDLPALTGAWGLTMAVVGVSFWIPGRFAIRDGILVMQLAQLMPFSTALVVTFVWHLWISLSEIFWALIASLFRMN